MAGCRRDNFFLDLPGPGLLYLSGSVFLHALGRWVPAGSGHAFILLAFLFTAFWLIGTVSNNFAYGVYPSRASIWAGRGVFAACLSLLAWVGREHTQSALVEALAYFLPPWGISWMTGGYSGTRIRLIVRQAGMEADETAAAKRAEEATHATEVAHEIGEEAAPAPEVEGVPPTGETR